MHHRTTYLSFWDIEMSNLPVGAFRRCAISKDEARSTINSARASGNLVCVAKADLGAPYCEREREHHEQLCAVLRDHAGIEIQLQDFFGRDCANPLCTAEVGEDRDLLVVTCDYSVDMEAYVDTVHTGVSGSAESFEEARARRLGNSVLRMSIAPDSIKFYLFEQLEGGSNPFDAANSGVAHSGE